MTTTHDKALSAFTDYFVRNYPGPDTIIFDPKWHAPKLFNAAMKAIDAAGAIVCAREPVAWLCNGKGNGWEEQNKITFDAEIVQQRLSSPRWSVTSLHIPIEAVNGGDERAFAIGDRVRKTKGSSWQGKVVGFYSTELTPVGYCVESEREHGSVQIYPESALEVIPSNEGREKA